MFPSNPTINDSHIEQNKTFVYNGEGWVLQPDLGAIDGSKWEDSGLTQIVPKDLKHIPSSIIDDLPSVGAIDSISFGGVPIDIIDKDVDLEGVVAKYDGVEVMSPENDTMQLADVKLSRYANDTYRATFATNDGAGNDIIGTYATKTENNSKQSLNTGYIDGMVLSINADTTKFNIASGHYVISDNNSLSPTAIIKTFVGVTAQSIISMAANATYIALDSNMAIVQQDYPFTDIQRRTLCLIGAAIHSNHLVINAVNEIKAPITGDVNQLHDFIKAVGALNLSGNVYSSNSGMLLNKSAGVIFALGINASNPLDPHQITIPLQTGLSFRYRLQNGTEYVDRTTIDPASYDLNGVLTPIPGTKYTVQYINLFQSGLTRIQYGQKYYANFDEAKANFEIDPFITETNIADNAVFRAFLILKGSATNLATEIAAGRAMFIPVDKFGNVISGGSAALTYDSIIAALGYIPASPTDLALKIDKTQNQITKDPTGFHEPSLVVVTGDSVTRKITLSGTVAASYRGELVAELIPTWLSPAHGADTTKKYFLSHNGTTASWSESIWTFDLIQIAIAKYDNVNATWKYYREPHGLMNWATHKELHETIGTYKGAGGDITDIILDSTVAANRRPNLSSLIINDEDLQTTISALTSKLYTQFNLTGASIENTVLDQADIVKLLVDRPYYNQFTTEWVNTLMPANSVSTIWIYAQPMAADAFSQKHRLLFVQPQWITQATGSGSPAILTAVNTEKLRNSSELNLNGLVAEEIVCISKMIIAYVGGNWVVKSLVNITGSKVLQSNAPAGSGITSVEHDETLVGLGTVASPLGVADKFKLSIQKTGIGLAPIYSPYPGTRIVTSVTLANNCTDISISRKRSGVTTNYNKTTLVGVEFLATDDFIIVDLTIAATYINANALIIF